MVPPTVTIKAPNGHSITINTGLFINNEWVEAKNNDKITSINPATEEALAEVSAGSAEDVDKAVKAARDSFNGPWRNIDGTARGNLLLKLADLIEADHEIISSLECLDSGKTLAKAKMDIKEAFEIFRYYGGWADKHYGETIDSGKHRFTYTLREPLGVCAGIIPWNYPLIMVALKLAPAIACGNTSVIKPSEFTPLSVLYFAELVIKAGIPAGVVNIVNGYGKTAGVRLSEHPDVNKIGFTGSTATGKLIMKAASFTMKRVSLETGGKSPLIVFDDADIPNALKWTHYGVYANQGQICTSTARIYVHEKIYDEFVKRFLDYTEKHAIVGDPFSQTTWVGPLVSKQQFDRVLSYVKIAKEEGATLVNGGGVYPNRPNNKGYFVQPTLFGNATPNMRISKEEIFGPFAVFTKFSSQEDVIALANDTDYGLSAAVFTNDVTRAIRVSEKLEAGMVWINSSNNSDPRLPFGGFKQSGLGREAGYSALDEYTQLKTVYLNLEFANDE
ncbi:aldehyde dehydrogenase domain-containing protein [Mariannaea sp. PMI_226]|nr:aldehyde dehydrogenase domain-containing protein [Mariannaea sp. PMI_226]